MMRAILHLNTVVQLRKTFSFLIPYFLFLIPYFLFLILFSACSSSKYISRQTNALILSDSNFRSAHIGISIYDPSTSKYLFTHQAEKYFIPASNTKLFTCYAAMKHLGDSLVAGYVKESDTLTIIVPNGDPTFLHQDFTHHPFYDYLRRRPEDIHIYTWWNLTPGQISLQQQFSAFGNGWAWNDYAEPYMAERSLFPMYGNIAGFYFDADQQMPYSKPKYFFENLSNRGALQDRLYGIRVFRDLNKDSFLIYPGGFSNYPITKPFATSLDIVYALLKDTLKNKSFNSSHYASQQPRTFYKPVHSQPTDSLLKPMMHRSDNFFAEQTLLMVSNEMTGIMNDAKIIDSLLRTDLKDLPQKPRWVDGSGLSRYNLFSPNDMVTVLNKMRTEFDWNRISTILPTGGEGTLGNYYLDLKERIFAKTGTLSNNIALSGFLITKQNKTLIFSVLVNNHMGNTTQIRKAVEKFLTRIVDKY